VTRRLEKNQPNFGKSSQNSWQDQNCQNIYIKVQFESPKHLHKTNFETLKTTANKPCFKAAYLGQNVKILSKQKEAQNVAISLG
jgi:hypothetical protein